MMVGLLEEPYKSRIFQYGYCTMLQSCLLFWLLAFWLVFGCLQRYTYRELQTIQMKHILLFVWAEQAILGSDKNCFKIQIRNSSTLYNVILRGICWKPGKTSKLSPSILSQNLRLFFLFKSTLLSLTVL